MLFMSFSSFQFRLLERQPLNGIVIRTPGFPDR